MVSFGASVGYLIGRLVVGRFGSTAVGGCTVGWMRGRLLYGLLVGEASWLNGRFGCTAGGLFGRFGCSVDLVVR